MPLRRAPLRRVGRKRVGAVKRRPARRMPMYRKVKSNPVPSFTETLNLGRYPTQAGQAFLVQFQQITQAVQYAQLYRQFRINRLTWTLVPDWNSFDVNASAGLSTINAPRIVYAIDDTVGLTSPLTEAAMLVENGCKIRALTKPIKISHVPVPFLGQAITTGGFASVNKKFQWLSTDAAGVQVPHGGVRCYVSNGGTPIIYTVYCKVNFSLKDPQ